MPRTLDRVRTLFDDAAPARDAWKARFARYHREVERLFRQVRQLRDAGVTLVDGTRIAAGAVVEAQAPPSATRRAAGKLWLAASWGLAGLAALYLRRSK